MRRWPLFAKLFTAFATLTLVSAGLFVLLSVPDLRRAERGSIVRSLEVAIAAAAVWAQPLLEGQADAVPTLERLRASGLGRTIRFTVVRADGQVLLDTHEEPRRMDDHGSRPGS